jgi:calcium-dependent protein kinase
MRSLLLGVQYIHEKNYMHRDLKPENILLKESNNFNVKIVDFGLSAIHKTFSFD